MSWQLWISGNQEDPVHGNPIPWEAMSQRSKWVNRRAKRYIAWKTYIQQCWLEKFGRAPSWDGRRIYRLDVHCVFKHPGTDYTKSDWCSHGDPTNLRKAVEDAIFGKYTGANDKHVWGEVTFDHSSAPGLLIQVWGTEKGAR